MVGGAYVQVISTYLNSLFQFVVQINQTKSPIFILSCSVFFVPGTKLNFARVSPSKTSQNKHMCIRNCARVVFLLCENQAHCSQEISATIFRLDHQDMEAAMALVPGIQQCGL